MRARAQPRGRRAPAAEPPAAHAARGHVGTLARRARTRRACPSAARRASRTCRRAACCPCCYTSRQGWVGLRACGSGALWPACARRPLALLPCWEQMPRCTARVYSYPGRGCACPLPTCRRTLEADSHSSRPSLLCRKTLWQLAHALMYPPFTIYVAERNTSTVAFAQLLHLPLVPPSHVLEGCSALQDAPA